MSLPFVHGPAPAALVLVFPIVLVGADGRTRWALKQQDRLFPVKSTR